MLVSISINYNPQVLLNFYIIIPEKIKWKLFYICPSVFLPLPTPVCRSDADVWRSERCCTPAWDASSFQCHGGWNPHGPYLTECCSLRNWDFLLNLGSHLPIQTHTSTLSLYCYKCNKRMNHVNIFLYKTVHLTYVRGKQCKQWLCLSWKWSNQQLHTGWSQTSGISLSCCASGNFAPL